MSTPIRPKERSNLGSTTPKLGRGIQQPDASFEARSVHQSESRVVENQMLGLSEQIIKRKTELAELLRSTGKKRLKKNEPGDDIRLMNVDFPDVSGTNELEDEDFFTKFGAVGGGGGSLLSDSFMASSSVDNGEISEAASYFFSEGSVEVHNGTFTTTTTVTRGRTSSGRRIEHSQHINVLDSELLEAERRDEAAFETVDGADGAYGDGVEGLEGLDGLSQNGGGGDTQIEIDAEELWDEQEEEQEEEEDQDAASESRGDGVDASSQGAAGVSTPHLLDSSATVELDHDHDHGQVEVAVRQQGHRTDVAGKPREAALRGPTSSCSASSSVHNISTYFESSPISHVEILQAPARSQQGSVGADDTGGADASSGEHKAGPQQSTAQGSREVPDRERTADASPMGSSSTHGNSFISVVSVGGSTAGELSHGYGSMSYTESLVHQLKVARSKNDMLQGKLRDIEELVDRNYGSISERSKLLTAERNKLERQRALLDDELVATKEELLFIRAQLQNKSARISELETELLEAQRMITVVSSEGSHNGNESDGDSLPSEPDGDNGQGYAGDEGVRPAGNSPFSPFTPFAQAPASSGSAAAALSPGAVPAADLFSSATKARDRTDDRAGDGGAALQHSEREVEILKSLLVEQEQQLSDAAQDRHALQQLTDQYQQAISENFQLAGFLEAAEKRSAELSAQMAELERRLRLAEDQAFEHEARAAQLEGELIDFMDAEQERVQLMVEEELAAAREDKARSPEPSPPQKQQLLLEFAAATRSTPAEPASDAIPQIVFVSAESASPKMPLLRQPCATPRVPRDGYAALLMLVAVLQVAVWALVLLSGLLYLGVLEGRFGVDILRDGGVYEQLFMLRGLAGLSAAARDNAYLTAGVQYCSAAGQGFVSAAVEVATKLGAVGMSYLPK